MRYRGYTAVIHYDEEDRIFYGHLCDTYDNVHFEGCSIDELESAFQEAVDDYLAYCTEINRNPSKPAAQKSGGKITVVVELSSRINEQAEEVAQQRGVSLDTIIEDALSHTVRKQGRL